MKFSKLFKMLFPYIVAAIPIMNYVADPADPGASADPADPGAVKAKPAFSGTMVEKKDPVSGNMIKIPIEMEAFLGHVISSSRSTAENKYKPLLEKLEGDTSELADVRSELQKLQEASMSAEEKAQTNAARKIAEFETKTKVAQDSVMEWKGRFESTLITNDVLSSFTGTELCNPEQTAILLQNEGQAKAIEILDAAGKPTGNYQTQITLQLTNEAGGTDIVEGTPKELFKKWIEQDRNLHHQVNTLPPGGGSSNGSGKGRGGVDYMKMTAEQRLSAARE